MSARDTVNATWGEAAPDWVIRLAAECDKTSQSKVAAQLNRSPALVSTVLRRKYAGDMAAVEEVVRGVYLGGTVVCPAQGTISTAVCRDWMQLARSYSNQTSERVRMYRACRACPRLRKEDEA